MNLSSDELICVCCYPKKGAKGGYMFKKLTQIIVTLFLIMGYLLVSVSPSQSDNFPNKPIQLINPFSPGGAHDAYARAFCSVAHQYFGTPVLTVVKSGGAGTVGTTFVAQSKPDGYTLLLGEQQSLIGKPMLEKLPYSYKSFVAVGRITYSPKIICALGDAPWNNLKELIEWMRQNPEKLIVGGIPGLGAEECTILPVFLNAGVKYKFMPFAGGGPAFQALLTKDINLTAVFPSVAGEYIKTGKLKALGVGSPDRLEDWPNIPTLKEQGFDNSFAMFIAAFAPSGIPGERLRKIREAFKQTVMDNAFQSIISRMGEKVRFMDGEQFQKTIPDEVTRMEFLAKQIYGK
jgi:tripartite-type tricarboxylate transporter receptor subunit TctC